MEPEELGVEPEVMGLVAEDAGAEAALPEEVRLNKPSPPARGTARLIRLCLVWAIATSTLAYVATRPNKVVHATVSMGCWLLILWVLVGGTLMWRLRDPVRERVLQLRAPWWVVFPLFCTLLAMTEEAITTSLTNLAPLFGVPIGKAYITASTNYLDVILYHSVVVFIPMYLVWTWMLSRWDFHPNAVLLLYGMTGVLAESITFGFHNLAMGGFWTLVYGLMVYLPAYSLPRDRKGIRPPPFWLYPLAVVLPIFSPIPLVLILTKWVHTTAVHFRG